MRVFVNPMVNFIWLGGLILVLGAHLSVLPDASERKRLRAAMGSRSEPLPDRRAPALLGLLLALSAPLQAAGEIPAEVDQKAYLEVATTILCDCGCHPQSVHACACGRAAEMREEIAAALTRGGPGGSPRRPSR